MENKKEELLKNLVKEEFEKAAVNSMKAFRATIREKDIEMYGEDYWKNKLLEISGNLAVLGLEWEDEYSEEIASGLDVNLSTIELARILDKNFS